MISIRPAKRQNTPIILGLAGVSKSGKSMSAHRLAVGLADGGRIIMLNTEPHGHHYADRFQYEAADIASPHRIEKYVEAIEVIAKEQPAVLIIDSLTHLWDGIGGMKETKDEIQWKMARGDESRLDKFSAAAWAEVKADENHFIYKLLELDCHILLTFRAKDKMHIPKAGGEWIIIPMQPIMSDRIAYETLFTLTFPEGARGVPDLALSAMREPFDTLIPKGKQIDEDLGRTLLAWSRGVPAGGSNGKSAGTSPPEMGGSSPLPVGTSRTPVDDWEDQINNVHTIPQRTALWERIRPEWGSLIGKEQKRLIDANERAKQRVGG